MPQPSQPTAVQNLRLTGTLSLGALFRFLTTVLTLIAIVLFIVGPAQLLPYRRLDSGIVAFPLIFLSLSLVSHIAVAAHYVFTELIYVEWRRPDLRAQSDSLLRIPERLRNFRRPEKRALGVAYGGAGLGMGFGAVLVAGFPLRNGVMIAGVVFTFLTAAVHLLLAVVPENRYRLTLTLWEGDQERQVRGGYVRLAEEELSGESIDLKSMA
ncbi:hypothetical protein MMC27_004275 [Xylographa pallens]|nr:hypothetical protein [Xylographa pallens]